MGKHLVLVGGGHAHMVTLANLWQIIEKGHRVTVVGPSTHHYYSGMGPGMLGKFYKPEEIRFATKHVVEKQGATFVLDKALKVDADKQELYLESGKRLHYDVISFNAGSFVPRSPEIADSEDIYSVKPIEKLQEAQERLLKLFRQKEIHVGVIGGGPSAVEVAGNVWRLAKDLGANQPHIRIFAGNSFMGRFPEAIQRSSKESLENRGIEICTNGYVKRVAMGQVELESGEKFPTDFTFLALGVKPAKIFADSHLPTGPDGGLLVNSYLQNPQYANIFGGGDCIYHEPQPLDKVGVYAVRQNPILYHNLLASLEETPLMKFEPGPDYLLIFNLGDGTGVLRKNWLQFDGRIAFWIKDWIDKRFIKKFQAIE